MSLGTIAKEYQLWPKKLLISASQNAAKVPTRFKKKKTMKGVISHENR